ncbi:MAG: ABC-2 family transporter protein [Oscillospiraceae bacterium]|nr:ABC-2 family transporter protein [Oscillospiraceae bacterium]
MSYLYVMKTQLIRSFTYRFDVYGNIIMQTIIMVTTAFFWKALFGSGSFGNGMTADKMLTYTIISSAMSVLFTTGVERRIQRSVQQGSISVEMIHPINVFGVYFAEDMGTIAALLFQNLLPIIIIGSLVIKVPMIVSVSAIPMFAASLVLSMGINWLLAAIFGMWAFTAVEMDALIQVKKHLLRLLSGSIIPIWFFPDSLRAVLEALPFVYIYQLPLDIYVGSASTEDILRRMVIQVIWFAVLGTAFFILQRRVLGKVMVQGG